jgi:hypothetical protein
VSAAAFSAGERGGEYEVRGDEGVGASMSIAERSNAVERMRETGVFADDARVGVHKLAKFCARRVR